MIGWYPSKVRICNWKWGFKHSSFLFLFFLFFVEKHSILVKSLFYSQSIKDANPKSYFTLWQLLLVNQITQFEGDATLRSLIRRWDTQLKKKWRSILLFVLNISPMKSASQKLLGCFQFELSSWDVVGKSYGEK